jgi:hypothetical protein
MADDNNSKSSGGTYDTDDSFYKIINDYYFNAGFTLSKGTMEILDSWVKNVAFHPFYKNKK